MEQSCPSVRGVRKCPGMSLACRFAVYSHKSTYCFEQKSLNFTPESCILVSNVIRPRGPWRHCDIQYHPLHALSALRSVLNSALLLGPFCVDSCSGLVPGRGSLMCARWGGVLCGVASSKWPVRPRVLKQKPVLFCRSRIQVGVA